MDWALWYLKVRLWKFDGTVSEKMLRLSTIVEAEASCGDHAN